MQNNFCKIYVCSKSAEKFILSTLREANLLINIKPEGTFVDENDEFDYNKEFEFPDGFLFFKYTVDIDFLDGIDYEYCKDYVNFVLSQLWQNNIPAVASCDYEDLLINKGGYKSKDIPWPQ